MSTEELPAPNPPSPLPAPQPLLPTWLWAPYALYAISAACILVGISKIILPVYDKLDVEKQMEKFYCLATLNLYEVALLTVALLLVLWRKVFDDAVALTLLIAIFLVASAVSIDTVAPDYWDAALLFGLAGLLAATAKVVALDRFIVGRFPRVLLAGVAAMLALNFLLPGVLGFFNLTATSTQLIAPWRFAWFGVLAAGVIVLGAAIRLPTGAAGAGDIAKPFLRTAMMQWIIALILFTGTVTHLYALTWAFNISIALAELLPAIGLLALVALELLRGYGFQLAAVDSAICLLPVTLTLAVVLLIQAGGAGSPPVGSPSDPVVFLAVFAAAVSLNAWRREQTNLHLVAVVYVVAAVLLAGVDVNLPFATKLAELNWNFAGFTLGASLALLAGLQRSVHLAMTAVLVLTASGTTSQPALDLVDNHDAHWASLAAILFGALTQLVYCAFRRDLPRGVAMLAAVALATGVVNLFFPTLWASKGGRSMALDFPVASGLLTLMYLAAVALWTRDWRLLIPGAAPMTIAALMPRESQGWVWVALSFLILALGAAASLRKGQRVAEVGASG